MGNLYIFCSYYLQRHSKISSKSIQFCQPSNQSTNIHTIRSPLISMISYIPGVTTGSPNNDPPCLADAVRLPTRNPKKDCLTQTFILSPLLCLLCSQYGIQDDLLLFANEQFFVCVAKLGSPVKLSVKPTGTATPGEISSILNRSSVRDIRPFW